MQIKTNNTNFTGSFRIKPLEARAQREIPELFTQGRQIFSNIIEKGDMFIVIRDNYDKRIGNYLKEKHIRGFEYYPEINTMCGLDTEKPEKLIELLKNKTYKIVTDIEETFAAIAKQKKANRKPKPSEFPEAPKASDEAKKIANTLRLNIENPKIQNSKKSTIVRDEEKKRTIEFVSTNRGATYVYVKPDSLNESCTRCILDGKGNIVKRFETPNEMRKFLKQFSELKKKDSNIFAN